MSECFGFVEKRKKWIAVLLIGMLILFYGPQLMQMQHIGYLTGSQGIEAQFHSIYWNQHYWSQTEKGASTYGSVEPSIRSFGYSMQFDPDESSIGMCDFAASQKPFTVDLEFEPKKYMWQYKTGSETLTNGTIVDVYKQFEMFRYKCDWSMNIWLSGSEAEAEGRIGLLFPLNPYGYAGSELWIKLVPRSFVYFTDNPKNVYFAPAYIGLADNAEYSSVDKDGKRVVNDAKMVSTQDIIPEAKGETMGIYYQRGGTEEFTEQTLLDYQGVKLDPEIFRTEYWIRVNFIEFTPINEYPWWWHDYWYPSVQLNFLCYVFVVGEWDVYIKTGEVPSLEPHLPNAGTGNWFVDWLASIMGNPFNQFWFTFILIAAIVIIVSVTSPGIWSLLLRGWKK